MTLRFAMVGVVLPLAVLPLGLAGCGGEPNDLPDDSGKPTTVTTTSALDRLPTSPPERPGEAVDEKTGKVVATIRDADAAPMTVNLQWREGKWVLLDYSFKGKG